MQPVEQLDFEVRLIGGNHKLHVEFAHKMQSVCLRNLHNSMLQVLVQFMTAVAANENVISAIRFEDVPTLVSVLALELHERELPFAH